MAEAMPVKLHEGNALSQESLVAETAVHLEELEMMKDISSDQKFKRKKNQPPEEVLLKGAVDMAKYYTEKPPITTHTRYFLVIVVMILQILTWHCTLSN